MRGELLRREDLDAATRDAMFSLMARHFEGVTRAVFEADLADKDHVILIRDRHGALRGFSALALVPARVDGEALWALYSGDTIVDRSAWGSFALATTWIDAVHRLRVRLGGAERLVWLLICSGPRTYRFLPVFFREFYPRFDVVTPPAARRLLDALAARRYGRAYDPGCGIVRLPHPQPLRPELRVAPGVPDEPHVACFHRLNPGHVRGDELVCLAEIDDANLTAAGRRMVRAGRRARGAGVPAP